MKKETDFYLQYTGDVEISSMTKTDLKNLIATGESSFLEFKHKVASPEKIAKEMSAFANTKGGKILIGVSDNGDMIGTESFYEEEFWLRMAASEVCVPPIPITIELLHVGERDVMIVEIPEAEKKPVYVKGDKRRTAYLRQKDESVVASDEMVEIMKNGSSDSGVTFEYGEREQQLFRFLNEYGDITIDRFSILINVTTYRAGKILVNLVSAGVLELFDKDGITHYTFSQKSS